MSDMSDLIRRSRFGDPRRWAATQAGLRLELADRLQGDTDAAIEADARRLAAAASGPAAPTSRAPADAFDARASGLSPDPPPLDMNRWLRAHASLQRFGHPDAFPDDAA